MAILAYSDEDVDFFKDWLRALPAQTVRPGKKGSENKGFERIGSEFHRWVHDQKGVLGQRGAFGPSATRQ